MSEQTCRFLVECTEANCPNALVLRAASKAAAALAATRLGWSGHDGGTRCPVHTEATP